MQSRSCFVTVRRVAVCVFFLACMVVIALTIRVFPLFPFTYLSPSARISAFRFLVPIALIPAISLILIGFFAKPAILSERTAIFIALWGLSPAIIFLLLRLGVKTTLVCYHAFLPLLLVTLYTISCFLWDAAKRSPRIHPVIDLIISALGVLASLFLALNTLLSFAGYTFPLYYAFIAIIAESILIFLRMFAHNTVMQICTIVLLLCHLLLLQSVLYFSFALVTYIYAAFLVLSASVRLAAALPCFQNIKGLRL